MVYQRIENETKVGSYSVSKSPGEVAKAIAKELYIANDLRGTRVMNLHFVKNRTQSEGGDVFYWYKARIGPAENPRIISVGDRSFAERFDVTVQRL